METNDKESDGLSDENLESNYTDDGNNEETLEDDIESINLNFPAISPVSNISSSSGFISCNSSSSSKPTTPTNLLTETDDEIRDKEEHVEDIPTDRCFSGDTNKFLSSPIPSSSKGVKNRSKYRNNSSDQQSRYRQSKKHISLDENAIYESDSSLLESRRRISHHRINFQQNNNNNNNNISSNYKNNNNNNQGRLSDNAAIISRHKSEENSTTQQPSNQIVSILKRKDSSGKDSPCLVTFSPNVKDTNNRSGNRQGILKKRSSLDESRRYRSHSPDSESEKGCLVKNNRRRNSCEEINHGILKQKSYESTGYSSSGTRSSGVNTPNSGVQGILKKPSLTPSDHDNSSTKHVSISEAVILAAAELCKDMIIDDTHEPYIKPILKLDNFEHGHEIKPKPILKKNHSSENEEIRSILKSRKSSREEQEDL